MTNEMEPPIGRAEGPGDDGGDERAASEVDGPSPPVNDRAPGAPERVAAADLAEWRDANATTGRARDALTKAGEALLKAQGVEEYLATRLNARYGLTDADRVDGDTGAITRA